MSDQQNFIVAAVLCLLVLVLWQEFVAKPQVRAIRETATTEETQAAKTTPAPAQSKEAPRTPVARAQALTQAARIKLDAPRIDGSISLEGARIDDVELKDYRETIDQNSAEIVLLSPRAAENAYYASFGWTSSEPNAGSLPNASTMWTAKENTVLSPGKPVELTCDNGSGLVFTRTISVDENYLFTVSDRVENRGDKAIALAPFGAISRYGMPHVQNFFILHEGFLGVFNKKLETYKYKKIAEDGDQAFGTQGGWLGITDKYWLTALLPDQRENIKGRFLKTTVDGVDVYQTDFTGEVRTVQPGGRLETTVRLFTGAKEVAVIDHYGDSLKIPRFDLAIDWGWFYFLTRPTFWLLHHLYMLVGNFGVAILMLTVIVKLAFFPIANRSYRTMSQMKKLQPEMTRLRERFKDDPQKQQQELMELYKREKVNPLAGCLPMVAQIPVFFSLYKVQFVTIEMRHAPFFGWIHDLSAPDPTNIFTLFGLIPWAPPTVLHIGLLPLLYGISLFVSQRLNPAPPDPMQQKIFMWMPVLFTFMFAGFPAGLVIYWTWNNLLSMLQQYVIMRRMGVDVELGKRFALPQFLSRLRGMGKASTTVQAPKERHLPGE